MNHYSHWISSSNFCLFVFLILTFIAFITYNSHLATDIIVGNISDYMQLPLQP